LQFRPDPAPFARVLSPAFARLLSLFAATGAVSTGLLAGCARSDANVSAEKTAPTVLRVSSDGEFLAFTPQELTCRTGERVRVIFHHAGQRLPQDHNWVLAAPGTAEAVMQAGIAAGQPNSFVPPRDPRVLAATPLCGRGAEAAVEFTAPAPGDYPFVCTFPGHGAEMRGVLHVTR
jgi:azurin